MGPSDPWDNYESLIINSNISAINFSSITISDLETIGIQKDHAKIILDARDKISGFTNSALINEKIDVNDMLPVILDVVNEYQFQFSMESWSISIVYEWVIHVVHSHENENWKKCLDIIYEQMIDGKVFKDADANALIKYGINENYAIALVQIRDEFLKRQKIHDNNIFIKPEDIKADTQPIMDESDNKQQYKINSEIGIFELALRLYGPLQLQLKLITNEGFVPDCLVHVTEIDFSAKLQIQFDMARNVMQICFLEKPKIKTNIDLKIKFGITIPVIGQEFWLPTLAETILEKRNQTNPIIVHIDN